MVRRNTTDLKPDTDMIKVFLVILFFDFCQCAVTVTPQDEVVTQGTSITIVATTDENAVTWTYKSGSPLSLCFISSSTCFIPSVENMVLSADASTNTSTIIISAVNCSINNAVYTATTSSGVATAEIVVTTPASSIDITTSLSTQKVSTQVLSFNIPCVDPKPVANFTITRQGKPDETIDGVTVGSSNSECQCTESTYTIQNTITASNYPNEVVNVAANVGQLSPVLIGTVNFTGSSEKSSNVGTIVGAVLGGAAGVGVTGGLVVVGSKLVKKQASVKNSEEDKSNKNSNEDKSKKNSKKRKSKNKKDQTNADDAKDGRSAAAPDSAGVKADKKDQTNADDAKDGRSAAAPDSAGVKADQNSAKAKQNVEFINEERSNMLKNKDSSNAEQKGTHTDDMEHKGTNSNNETKTDTTYEAAVTEEKTIFLSMNTA